VENPGKRPYYASEQHNVPRSKLAEGLTKKVSEGNAPVPELLRRGSFEGSMVEIPRDGEREHTNKGFDVVGSFEHERLHGDINDFVQQDTPGHELSSYSHCDKISIRIKVTNTYTRPRLTVNASPLIEK
jgi:hypothetical protein